MAVDVGKTIAERESLAAMFHEMLRSQQQVLLSRIGTGESWILTHQGHPQIKQFREKLLAMEEEVCHISYWEDVLIFMERLAELGIYAMNIYDKSGPGHVVAIKASYIAEGDGEHLTMLPAEYVEDMMEWERQHVVVDLSKVEL